MGGAAGLAQRLARPRHDRTLRAYSELPSPSHAAANNGNILSTFSFSSRESFEVTVSGGSTFARVKLKEIDGMAPQDVERAV